MEKLLTQLDAALDNIELEVVAENADADEPGYRLPAGLTQRQVLRQKIQQGLAQLQADGRKHYHRVEPEARRMKVSDTNRYAYNAQAIADGKEGVILACEATREESDVGQLTPMMEQARENLGAAATDTLTVADNGYGSGADLQAAAQKQMNVLAQPREGKPAHDNPYAAQHFHYDPQNQSVTCPQNRVLDHEGHSSERGVRVERYRCHHRDCPVRDQCTNDPKGRKIDLQPHAAIVQAMRQRLKTPEAQAQLSLRREIIERRFGQIKQHDGFRRWTIRGLEGVKTQWALLCTTLNLRVIYDHWRKKPNKPPKLLPAIN